MSDELRKEAIGNYFDKSGAFDGVPDVVRTKAVEEADEFIKASGMTFMFALWDQRAKQAEEDAAYEAEYQRLRAQMMIKVQFPDGVREVQGIYESVMDISFVHQRHAMVGFPRLVPEPMDGWEFRATIGSAPNWHAFQVQTKAERERYARLWRAKYETKLPWHYNEDHR